MDDQYECIGICERDPDSGICLGCGRPLTESGPADADALPASGEKWTSQ